jgi:hypothetical protein
MRRFARIVGPGLCAGITVVAMLIAPAASMAATARSSGLSYSHRQLVAARQQVRIAKAEGPAAVRILQSRILGLHARVTAAGTGGPTADQQALAVALYQSGTVVADTPAGSTLPAPAPPTGIAPSGPTPMLSMFRSAPIAHSASCWGRESSWWNHTVPGGAIVAKLEKFNYGWCGTGSQLTSGAYNFDHWQWAQYPYCLANESNRQGPDGTSGNWAHGGIWATTGIYSVAVVCVPILGGEHAVLRIAGNGYWDRYDDYGF